MITVLYLVRCHNPGLVLMKIFSGQTSTGLLNVIDDFLRNLSPIEG